MKKSLFILIFIFFFVMADTVLPQDDAYYSTLNTSLSSFVYNLKLRIRSPYTRIDYNLFDETNIANFASFDNGNGTRTVFCVYSNYPYSYTPPFTWAVFSREHTWCQSWMPYVSENTDQYQDQHHLFPSHQNGANNVRSNHPLGFVANVTSIFYGAKYGTDSNGYTVYESRTLHKGDAARALFYMAVRYDSLGGYAWNFTYLNNYLTMHSEGPQNLNTLLQWHALDPPDKWEVDRNNYIQSIQQNRNPFVDHPEYAYYVNFNTIAKLSPVFSAEPDNFATNFSASTNVQSITVSWTDAVTGNQAPSGYLLQAYDSNYYYIPIDGSVYQTDSILSDGKAVVNIPYSAANTYTFDNLTPSKTYYFRMYSYNGNGSLINYKITSTVPTATSVIGGSLSPEPANYVTNFQSGTATSSSIPLSWTDAVNFSQLPSGYLLLANNTNVFTAPSDAVVYGDDINLSDGSAVVNINYPSTGTYTFTGLPSSTNYYFKMFSYNGTGASRNYKTDGVVPFVSAATTAVVSSGNTAALDNFNRINNNAVGSTPTTPTSLAWSETETVSGTGVKISSNRLNLSSSTSGRDYAYLNMSGFSGYPTVLGSASGLVTWAFNFRQTRLDPSGFDPGNYGMAFILGMSSATLSSTTGYAVVLGNSGSTDAIRLVSFNGITENLNLTNIISGNDYGTEYLSVKVTYNPGGNVWSLFAESNASDFPQIDPRNTSVQIGSATANSIYTGSALNYLACLWNHNTTGTENAVFDDIYVSDPQGALPVTLTDFSASSVNNSISLKWTVEDENLCRGYEIKRYSFSNNTWTDAGFVTSINSLQNSTYSFSDKNLSAGNYFYRLKQIDFNGNHTFYNLPYEVTVQNPTKLILYNNYPNPFNPTTKIRFEVPLNKGGKGVVSLRVYDISGKEVATLVSEVLQAGYYEVEFDGTDFASGIYICRLTTGTTNRTIRMLLIK